MFIRLPRLISLLACLSAVCANAAEPPEGAVAPKVAFDQRLVSNKACGPTALLNAFRFGDANWQRALSSIPGATDKQRISSIIRAYGMRPSRQLVGRSRWSSQGINLLDLTDVANEIAFSQRLPGLKNEVLVPLDGNSSPKLIALAHKRFAASLGKGLPPVLSLRRFAWRKTNDGKGAWLAIDAHYVTLTALPPSLERNARGFQIAYLDPNGGRRCTGNIHLPDVPSPAGLLIDCPRTPIGRYKVRPGEATVVMLSGVLGRW